MNPLIRINPWILLLIGSCCCVVNNMPTRIPEKIYREARKFIQTAEDLILLGGRMQLTEKEEQVDVIIKSLKAQEFTAGIENPATFAPSMHFFHAKKLIEKRPIFRILKIMPKGALLHAHNGALVSSKWLLKNLTYWPQILKCTNKDGLTIFTFRRLNGTKNFHECDKYQRVSDERAASGNATAYDIQLEKMLSLFTTTPEIDYSNIELVWTKFQNIFKTLGDAYTYKDAFIAFTKETLRELYEDNIMYVEFRTSFSPVYDENGKQWNKKETAALMKEIVDEFKLSHKDFIGGKCIFSTHRNVESDSIHSTIELFKELHNKWPEWVMGYDLVGQEDIGKPLITFLAELRTLPNDVNFFFHAGETNWYGTTADENLIDAVLMGAHRIGHGYAITKHPVIMNAVKERDICIEVNPISNQVLHLVHDLRNHPAAMLSADSIPFVIASDDPGFWGASGLSYDFYYAFMCFSPEDAGIAYLKTLVWNSLKYSILTDDERKMATYILMGKWEKFLNHIIYGSF